MTLLAGCGVTTVNPIGISSGAAQDESLLGVWRIDTPASKKDPGGYALVFFYPYKDGHLQAVMLGVSKDHKSSETKCRDCWLNVDIFTGKAGDNRIFNVKFISSGGEQVTTQTQDYIPFLYRFDPDGTMHVFMLSSGAADALHKGGVAGTYDDKSKRARLTADPKSLDRFFAKNAQSLFTDPYAVLRRVN